MKSSNVFSKTSSNNGFMNLLNYRSIPSHSTDREIVLDVKFEYAPDLLSYELYGDAELWWVIPQRNGLEDPVFDLKEGITLTVPNISLLKAVL